MNFDLEAFLDRYQFLLMVAVLVPLLALETYRPLAPGRRGRLVHGLRNAGLFLLGSVVFGFVLVLSAKAAELTNARHFGLFHLLSLPTPARVVLGLLAIDFMHYGRHFLMHKVPLFWRLHRVHHSDPDVDATSLFRIHPLENLTVFVCQGVLAVLLGIPPLALLLHSVLNTASAMVQHSNVRMPAWADRWMSLVLTSPGMHRVHHSRHVEETDTNYGPIFSCWDRLFGTYLRPPEDRLIELGLAEFDAPQHQTLRGMLMTPFITPEALRPVKPAPMAPKRVIVPLR